MSQPERLLIKRLPDGDGHIEEELRVCLVETLGPDPGDRAVVTSTPRPDDIAYIMEHASEAWVLEFMLALLNRAPNRAMAVAAAIDGHEVVERVRSGIGGSVIAGSFPEVQDPELTEIGGFGMSPGDSKALLELRLAIDTHLGWPDTAAEQAADYVGRIKQAGEVLADDSVSSVLASKVTRLEQKLRAQRDELRRFNREARARAEGHKTTTVIKEPPETLGTMLTRIVQERLYAERDSTMFATSGSWFIVNQALDLLRRSPPPRFTERMLRNTEDALVAWIGGM